MLEKITQFFRDFNNIGTGNKYDKLLPSHCCSIRNAPDSLYPDSGALWQTLENHRSIPPGEGVLPEKSVIHPLTTPKAKAIENMALLLTLPVANIGNPAVSPGAIVEPHYATRMLHGIDRAVNRILNQLLPWQPVDAREQSEPDRLVDYQFHPQQDDPVRFAQQLGEFLQRINLPLSESQFQQFAASLQQTAIIFGWPEHSERQPRALKSEMKRRVMLEELWLTDQRVRADSIGARMISWGEQEKQHSCALFMQGVESGNVEYLLKSGLTAVLAEFVETTGELFTGEIFDRQPGESSGERVLRVAANFVNPSEAVAAKAFSFKPSLIKPLPKLKGTFITHAPSGATFQSVLQAEIAGMQWRLFPEGELSGVAMPGGKTPIASRQATFNPQNNQWRIEGMPGEYRFTHPAKTEIFVQTPEGYYPVKASLDDGTLLLSSGEKIYFNQQTQQWALFYAGNTHLHARCMNAVSAKALTVEPGRQGVLRTSSGSQRRLWQTQEGKYYLEIRSAAETPGGEIIYYLEGWPEGEFFTLKATETTPLHQQTVLRWLPERNRWDIADSPFRRLNQVEHRIEQGWLQRQPGPERLTPVANRPGLYHLQHRFWLRWRSTAAGETHYLALLPTEHPDVYIPEQSGADDLRFYYDENNQQWRFLPLTQRAFRGLPDKVKVVPENAFSASYRLPGYQNVYRSGDDLFIHIGSDNQGFAGYIRVKQDLHNPDLFTLSVAEDDGTDSRWQFRYNHHKQEFERPHCLRVRRSDRDPCAGPSGLSDTDQSWFNWHPQAYGESSVAYARRLYTMHGNHPGDRAIELHTGVNAETFHKIPILPKPQRIRSEEQQWLDNFPRRPGEDSINYGLRLLAIREEQLAEGSITSTTIDKKSIADYARASKEDIAFNLRIQNIRWLTEHPRLQEEWPVTGETSAIWQEKSLAYAGRLLKARCQPPKAMLLGVRDIAAHAGLSTDVLLYKMQVERRGWLEKIVREPDEQIIGDENLQGLQVKNQLYARRIAAQRDSEQLAWLISDKDIANHARVTILTLRQLQQPEFVYSLLMPPPEPELEVLPDTRLLSRQWEDWRHLLVDASDLSQSLTQQLIKSPVKAEPMRQKPKGVSRARWAEVKQQFTAQAQALIDSDGQSHQGFSIENLEVVMDEQNPEIGVQIIARQKIPAWTFIGGYSGVWHATEASLFQEFRKMGSERVLTYLWRSKKRGAVSGLQNANKMALINTGSIKGFSAQGVDNVAVGYINDLLPFYYTVKDVEPGEQLLISYGDFYNPKYFIQATINNDIIDIVARSENKYFVIKSLGDNIATIHSPGGRVERVPKGEKAFTLQEKMGDKYFIRYDIISKKGKKVIAIENNTDHLYYALARAMDENGGQDIIAEKVSELKAVVAAAHPEDQIVKAEPQGS